MDKTRYSLALDMDETLCSLIGGVISKMQPLVPSKTLKLPTYGKYNHWFREVFPGSERDLLSENIFQDEFYLNLKPTLNGFDGHTIEKLSRMCWERFDHIQIITHREGFMQNPKEVTKEWLKRNGFIDSERLEVHVADGSTSKLKYLKKSTVIVDDSISVADEVTKSSNHHMMLVSHPWNDGYPRAANCTIVPVRRLIERIRSVSESL